MVEKKLSAKLLTINNVRAEYISNFSVFWKICTTFNKSVFLLDSVPCQFGKFKTSIYREISISDIYVLSLDR